MIVKIYKRTWSNVIIHSTSFIISAFKSVVISKILNKVYFLKCTLQSTGISIGNT